MKPEPVLTPRKPEKLFAQMDQILCLHFSLLTGRNLLQNGCMFLFHYTGHKWRNWASRDKGNSRVKGQ